MISTLLKPEYGFVPVTDYNLSTGEGLEPGDIFMKTNHTGMYVGDLGDGPCYVDASHNERRPGQGDRYHNGIPGDQVQEYPSVYPDDTEEIGIRNMSPDRKANFDFVYRYVGV